MRNLLVSALVCSLACPALAAAETIRAQADRAAVQAAGQNVEATRSGQRRTGMLLTGGGAALIVLSMSALKSETEDSKTCTTYLGPGEGCGVLKKTNKALFWGGVGLTALGVTLWAKGEEGESLHVVGRPGNVALEGRLRF